MDDTLMTESEDDEMIDSNYDSSSDEADLNEADFKIVTKEKPKQYQVDFKVHSIQDILNFQQQEISHVEGVLGAQKESAATLLRHFKWNKEKLIEKYFADSESTMREAGVFLNPEQRPKLLKINGFCCDICCDDDEDLESLALSCQHRFCINCYQQYLELKIKDEGESRNIQCPGRQCSLKVDEKTVELVVSEDVFKRYVKLLLRTYVDDKSTIKWCPSPNCEYAVECSVTKKYLQEIVPTVTCLCGYSWCFGCSLSDHQPSICELVKIWLKKCEDDSETANWMNANTKECVKCNSVIEKNGPWSDHGSQWYTCNRFDEKAGIEARDAQAKSRAALERYLHYFNRYANHLQSQKLDKETYEKIEKKMEQVQINTKLSWIEVQFIKQAATVLFDARGTLRWTYAFAYYLSKPNNQTELFEDNQRDLEMAVEQLSELLESPLATEEDKIRTLRDNMVNKLVYVSQRREIILEDTSKGLLEGRWKYNVKLKGDAVTSTGSSSVDT
ncbi:hypothetical protein HDU92_002824 [Lobulomyces angularis]|nr:hypothetical protein HDU92_002824 [Lobulomyces angularis]